MNYWIDKSVWQAVFAVPAAVVDRHIRLCSDTALRVLLILLRNQEPLGIDALMHKTGVSATAEIEDALCYWEEAGILAPERRRFDIAASVGEEMQNRPIQQPRMQEDPAAESFEAPEAERELLQIQPTEPDMEAEQSAKPEKPVETDSRTIRTLSSSRTKLNTSQINEMARYDETVAMLLQEAQAVLGKPLSPVASETVVALYSYYDMEPDLVLMLLQYCVTIGHDSMRYVEKVAASWLEKGVNTHEKAEQEILRATRRQSLEGQIKQAFGIHDRRLVQAELNYAEKWVGEFGFSIDVITMAYERAIELKGKLSFAYINGILTNWHGRGVETVLQAEQEIRNRPGNTGSAGGERSQREGSYSLDELELAISGRIT